MLHEDDFGQSLLLSVDEDLSTGSPTVTVVLQRPDGTTVSRTNGTALQTAAPAVIKYVLVSGDLTAAGVYTAQVFAQWTSPARGVSSDPITFVVGPSVRTPPWYVAPSP